MTITWIIATYCVLAYVLNPFIIRRVYGYEDNDDMSCEARLKEAVVLVLLSPISIVVTVAFLIGHWTMPKEQT